MFIVIYHNHIYSKRSRRRTFDRTHNSCVIYLYCFQNTLAVRICMYICIFNKVFYHWCAVRYNTAGFYAPSYIWFYLFNTICILYMHSVQKRANTICMVYFSYMFIPRMFVMHCVRMCVTADHIKITVRLCVAQTNICKLTQ